MITMKTNERNGAVMGARQVVPNEDVMLVSNKGQMIRIRVGEISEQGRNTQGRKADDGFGRRESELFRVSG